MLKRMPITVSRARTGESFKEALDFIDARYLALFDTTPPRSHVYFVARRGGQIVGTVALDFCDENGNMPIANIYAFDHERAPFPTDGKVGAQFGRWVTTVPYASGPLLYAATDYALSIGKRSGWCEHNDAVHRTTERLGVPFKPIKDAVLEIDKVAKENRIYYTTPPFMKCYMMDLKLMKQGLAAKSVNNLVASERIELVAA